MEATAEGLAHGLALAVTQAGLAVRHRLLDHQVAGLSRTNTLCFPPSFWFEALLFLPAIVVE
jgi:hypothetical protein